MSDEVLMSALLKMAKDDNTDPDASSNEFCVHHYVADNVFSGWIPTVFTPNMQITIDVVETGRIENLPNENMEVTFHIWTKRKISHSMLKSIRLKQRIKDLFGNQVTNINGQGYSVKCRVFDFVSAIPLEDELQEQKMIHIPVVFSVILGT